ncbi:unnamed protein product [Hermetia illucens]|uniref:BPTI/Kunitz inhibitor domain-containing protein n=1 Tax=Hermetia illucens TaxID=343691 RepID=A0A7R8UJT1_HERIL|nr:PI-actitoxin-Aeq3a-like [Hermetia illucens]CAD7082166.1 unnamed protein product [Hermetia illucens]
MLAKFLILFGICAVLMVNLNIVQARDSVCQLPAVTGRCRAFFRRYYYDTKTKKCQLFVYGGCDSNGNNFLTRADCEKRCKT